MSGENLWDKIYSMHFKDAERRFTEDFPNWDMELIKFPPGELYYDQMKPCTRAKDLEEKYGNKLAKDYLCHT